MMIMAYDKNGMIATDRVPLGSTVTAAYYTVSARCFASKDKPKKVRHVHSWCPHFA